MTIYTRPSDLPAFAESGDKVQPSNAEIQTGWPLSTVPPSRQRFNWILNFVANAVRYFMQRGVAEWSTNEDYPLAGRVQHAGVTWVAILANTGIEPGTDPLTWERWGYSESELIGILDPITPDSINNRVGINSASPSVTLDIVATDAIKIPSGTTAERPTGANGLIRHNSTLNIIEGWLSGVWTQIGGTIADASTTVKGIVELATDAEAQAASDTQRALTPSNLAATVIGINQTWQNVTGSRVSGTTYTNTTGKPIMCIISVKSSTIGGFLGAYVSGNLVGESTQGYNNNAVSTIGFIVPNLQTYSITTTSSNLYKWTELR